VAELKSIHWRERVRFQKPKPGKADLWRGARLFAGLNCFLEGQSQSLHEHARADKLYLVLEGSGVFQVGEESFEAGAGDIVPAPAGVPHGVRNERSEALVVLTVIAPPPEETSAHPSA
jgi:mannose-6-phosphate isomerase-like protein (cupin superfamily)